MNRLLFIPLMFICSIAFAEPSVTSQDAGTISGEGFGTKTTAAPVLFEDFEDGEDGELVSSTGYWSIDSDNADEEKPRFSSENQRHSSSTLSSKHILKGNHDIIYRNNINQLSESGTAYADFYVYYTAGYGDGEAIPSGRYQIKVWRFLSQAPGYVYPSTLNETWRLPAESDPPGGEHHSHYYEYRGFENYGQKALGYPVSYNVNEWNHVQMELKMSDVDTANGIIRVWQNNVLVIEDEALNMRESLAHVFKAVQFGEGAYNGATAAMNMFDDIYIDDTWARVFVAKNADGTGNREIQIPTSWSDTEISVTWNQGSFENYTPVYIFVVDENGDASNGLEGFFVNGTFYDSASSPSISTIQGKFLINGKVTID